MTAPAADPRLQVFILSGVRQSTPPDVMRGEETQTAGYLSRNPDLSGSVCLPGTHTKWVRISNGRIEEFRAYLSGEFFGLLRTHSVLRFFLDGEECDDSVFAETAEASLAAPQTFLSDLFGIRADALLNGMPSGVSRPRLSGLILERFIF